MWLFRLPRLRKVVNRRPSSVAVISFVVVLPALPVMATTVDCRAAPDHASGLLQAVQGVLHHDHRKVGRRHGCGITDDDSRGASRDGLGNEGMPVEPWPADRDVQIAGDERARVDRHRRQQPVLGAVAEHAAERVGHFARRQGERLGAHRALPVRRRSAARATAPSSKGSTRSPMVCVAS